MREMGEWREAADRGRESDDVRALEYSNQECLRLSLYARVTVLANGMYMLVLRHG